MEEDVAKALAYQVKRDLAERYFGARRAIEEDSKNYFRKIEELKKKFLPKLAESFARIYTLLNYDEELIKKFLEITGLKEAYFRSEQKDALETFKGFKLKGFTSKGRFKNLFLESYARLYDLVNEYRKELDELKVEAEVINHEIEIFKEKFNLTEIMHFLKDLEGPSEFADLGLTSLEESVSKLEDKLEFKKIPPPEKFLPDISALPPLKEISKPLGSLAKEAFNKHKERALELLKNVKQSH
ncbi:hypothetical protein [Thermodesulfatator atlanticus]|uniref:hypothetical protein n=1 Tax=Thermodesulfatator atlanticus TaxID=501497 RepID=UPI0003B33619|nr:hypothetical protein [Thermodesulfatator atlanticus]